MSRLEIIGWPVCGVAFFLCLWWDFLGLGFFTQVPCCA